MSTNLQENKVPDSVKAMSREELEREYCIEWKHAKLWCDKALEAEEKLNTFERDMADFQLSMWEKVEKYQAIIEIVRPFINEEQEKVLDQVIAEHEL